MRTVLRWVQPILAGAAAVSIAYLLSRQWQDLQGYPWSLSPLWLAASAALMLAAWCVEIQIWRMLLWTMGAALPFLSSARIWFLSAIVRYVPGNIWQPLSLTLYAQKLDVRPETTLTSVVFYQVIILLAAAPLAGLYFAVTGNWGMLTSIVGGLGPELVFLVVLPVVIFVLWPTLLVRMVNWVLTRVGRATIETGLRRGRLITLLLIGMVDWLIWGSVFATLTFGIASYSPAQIVALTPHLVAAYAIAYCIGFLSFITPSGFGVREGTLYVLLSTILPGSVITVSALTMRMWNILGEVIMASIAALGPWGRSPAQPSRPAARIAQPASLGSGLEQEPGA